MGDVVIWRTGHGISDSVSTLLANILKAEVRHVRDRMNRSEINIAYGILRGSGDVFRKSGHWFEIDKGYWGAAHYDGNYRISYRNTQGVYDDVWGEKECGVKLEGWKSGGSIVLICPPTEHVCRFFGIDMITWIKDAVGKCEGKDYVIRMKEDTWKINWDRIRGIITFNSTLGVEALRRGIPVISDEENSMIGSYYKQKCVDYTLENVTKVERMPLFNCMNSHQFKLE